MIVVSMQIHRRLLFCYLGETTINAFILTKIKGPFKGAVSTHDGTLQKRKAHKNCNVVMLAITVLLVYSHYENSDKSI